MFDGDWRFGNRHWLFKISRLSVCNFMQDHSQSTHLKKNIIWQTLIQIKMIKFKFFLIKSSLIWSSTRMFDVSELTFRPFTLHIILRHTYNWPIEVKIYNVFLIQPPSPLFSYPSIHLSLFIFLMFTIP